MSPSSPIASRARRIQFEGLINAVRARAGMPALGGLAQAHSGMPFARNGAGSLRSSRSGCLI